MEMENNNKQQQPENMMDIEAASASDDKTSADYYFDSYSHFGNFLSLTSIHAPFYFSLLFFIYFTASFFFSFCRYTWSKLCFSSF